MKERKTKKSHYVRPWSSVLTYVSENYLLAGTVAGGHLPGDGGDVIGDAYFDGDHEGATGGFIISDINDDGTHADGQGGGILGDWP